VAGNLMFLSPSTLDRARAMAILRRRRFLCSRDGTMIEAERVGASSPDGAERRPIVEFAYFQTASGPGTCRERRQRLPSRYADPYPQLERNCSSAGQPASASPLAGALTDLHTYTQWSWPLDGATGLYGYDVNVEFVESYVNALTQLSRGQSVDLSLHFRCVDRNNNHTLLVPNAIHVPSIPQQGALRRRRNCAAASYIPQTPIPIPRWRIDTQQQALLEKRAAQAVHPSVLAASAPVFAQPRFLHFSWRPIPAGAMPD